MISLILIFSNFNLYLVIDIDNSLRRTKTLYLKNNFLDEVKWTQELLIKCVIIKVETK